MAWETSNRRSRLPTDWNTRIRPEVRRRASGQCQAEHHAPRCDGTGTDADHIITGDDHSYANLQWLSKPCHDAKTAREAAARSTARATMRRRPPERHPGAIT